MFPNFLIPNLRQLTMRDVIHINDSNTARSRIALFNNTQVFGEKITILLSHL